MGTRTHITLALAALVLVAVCAWIVVARPFAGAGSSAAPATAVPTGYTMAQYRQLKTGMGLYDVDTIMGGGASVMTSESGGLVTAYYSYMNEDLSGVTVTFVGGLVTGKMANGL